MNRTNLRIATVVIALGGLSACGAIQESGVLQSDFWTLDTNYGATAGGAPQNNEAELGLAELAKGDNFRAQGHFEAALNANPNDIHALYGLAVLYQNTGQPSRARQLYERILSIRPAPSEELLIWADKRTHPIIDIAQVNLQLLDSGSMAAIPGAPMPGSMQQQAAQQPGVQQGLAQPQSQLYVQPRMTQPQVAPPQMGQAQMNMAPIDQPMFKDADLNIVARFNSMRALLGQGLITQDEFVRRRMINLGALLPMTAPPAATGLDRPVPSVDQISGRLRAIGRALEMRALSPAQHTAERTMILDALMPANPASVANPPPPPQGLMEAADAVRRLEMLKASDIITSDEYVKERAAIESSMQPAAPAPMAGAAKPMKMGAEAKPAVSGFRPAVHLASYRQKGAAERGWKALSKRFGQLSGLQPKIERVDLGSTKGVFYRLKAGPLPSNGAAQDLCRQLKAKRQFCEPSTINFG